MQRYKKKRYKKKWLLKKKDVDYKYKANVNKIKRKPLRGRKQLIYNMLLRENA